MKKDASPLASTVEIDVTDKKITPCGGGPEKHPQQRTAQWIGEGNLVTESEHLCPLPRLPYDSARLMTGKRFPMY